ncbi:MAG TPA: cation diffusion facilitator family transporter [Syntrophomonadaceae bacterium]|nr:cation diffusion facilitator family transporter [Syntrophomonadaceae bacterium]
MEIRTKAAWFSVLSNTILMCTKLVVGVMIGSISVISEAIHSANDLLASFIALFAVKTSTRPPDKEHPYGHGKIENVSGTIEALLIFLAAGLIIKEAIDKIQIISHGGSVINPGWGIVVMGFSALMNLLVSTYLLQVGRKTDSVALEADGMHLRTDVYTSLGVFIGLVLIKLTGYQLLDPIAAILVALLIVKAAYDLTEKAFRPLMDTALDDESIALTESILKDCCNDHVKYHELRTRKAGRESYIDLHLVINPEKSIQEAHDLCDLIEKRISTDIPYSHVLIHVEPDSSKPIMTGSQN